MNSQEAQLYQTLNTTIRSSTSYCKGTITESIKTTSGKHQERSPIQPTSIAAINIVTSILASRTKEETLVMIHPATKTRLRRKCKEHSDFINVPNSSYKEEKHLDCKNHMYQVLFNI